MISDLNIKVDPDLCYACGLCVERCIMDNLRLSIGPCRTACPLHMNCQGYIRLLAQGREVEAAEEMRRETPFGAILGRVCSHPCEAECERGQVDDPVHIRALKRYLADQHPEIAFRPPLPAPETGLSAAIIGSGPAGLTAAYHLRAQGHQVFVYEAEPEPGGLLRTGIPSFRLPPSVVDRSVDLLAKMGVDFVTGTKVGQDLDWPELEKRHQAVLLAAGAGPSLDLKLPGQDLDQVVDALTLLKGSKQGHVAEPDPSVVVVGGGNTAVDAALTCRLMGAGQVKLVALEALGRMPAHDLEIKEALEAGVEVLGGLGPIAIRQAEKGLVQIEFSECLSLHDQAGRFAPVLGNDCALALQAQKVVLAAGQKQQGKGWPQGLLDQRTNLPLIDPLTKQASSLSLYFACGDMETGPSSVVEAMASAKEAAVSVDRYLKGDGLGWGRDFWKGGLIRDYRADHARAKGGQRKVLDRLGPDQRRLDLEVESTLDASAAAREAERCLSCGRSFEANRTCWYCLPCEIECPVKALQVRMPYLVR
jgi:NADPH-dependent glutamate synthase beta subunit-like oxidoreductase